MPILNVKVEQIGNSGVFPAIIYILTNDTLAEVSATGYLNGIVSGNTPLSDADIALVTTKTTPNAKTTQVGWFAISKSGENWSLTAPTAEGGVILPTIANHLATYTNALGQLSEDAATAINGGNIQAGLSGTAGYLASFPATAARGSLRLVSANSAGNTVTQITNASQAAARVYTIPDGGQAASNFLLSDNAGTQTIATGSLSLTLGNITASAGNIAATLGSLSAGTTVTGGTGVTATTGNVSATAGAVSAGTTVTGGTGVIATTGNITATTGNIIATAGSVTAGSSGNAGVLTSFPATAANGSLIVAGVNAGGAFNTTISNGTMGQATVYTLGDIGASTGGIVVATSAIRMKSVAAAANGGGNAAQTFTDAFCTSGSNVVGNWNTQANPASVLKIVPGNGSFVVTSSADAGVGTFNYIITK
jgi:hypothetical protein